MKVVKVVALWILLLVMGVNNRLDAQRGGTLETDKLSDALQECIEAVDYVIEEISGLSGLFLITYAAIKANEEHNRDVIPVMDKIGDNLNSVLEDLNSYKEELSNMQQSASSGYVGISEVRSIIRKTSNKIDEIPNKITEGVSIYDLNKLSEGGLFLFTQSLGVLRRKLQEAQSYLSLAKEKLKE